MPRHMALIGEACGDGGLGKRKPADDPSPNPKETPADEMAMRRSTHLRAEAASETEAVDTGLAVEILRGHRTLDRSVEKGTRTVYCSVVVWATRLADLAIAAGATARPTALR